MLKGSSTNMLLFPLTTVRSHHEPVFAKVSLRRFYLSLIAACIAFPAFAATPVDRYVPEAKRVGTCKMSVVFWDIYNAALIAPKGEFDWEKPFALQLDYLRDVTGSEIADRSVEEMRIVGADNEVRLAAWHTQMKQIFPDVHHGSQITGIYTPDGPTYFYGKNRMLGKVQDSEFGYWFFRIWLGENTSEPKLRAQLLGQK
ncbi:MAG: hypothetical protein CMM93_05850 [Rickettsiales bacterium]|nr:hypothetical protein [Rickettsiales bacterium]|tara:strand:- start:137 stop:736 length:600 start_codon:yes stop_codon:yes gene_type:complete